MKKTLAKHLKPGVYKARIWSHNKRFSLLIAEPHPWFEPGCRVQSATVGAIGLDWYTLIDPDWELFDLERLM